jgi:hypothetical protein
MNNLQAKLNLSKAKIKVNLYIYIFIIIGSVNSVYDLQEQ